jgi:EAL domain-containing protein (putative c-di-GMP-specific phosphodiesterase class I)
MAQFRVDTVTIGGPVVDRLVSDPTYAALVGALVKSAHHLDLKVVAEGISTPQQMEALRNLGCDLACGPCFSQPLSAGDFEAAWLAGETRPWRAERPDGQSATRDVA